MEFKDYYATLGIERTASQDEIKLAYRKLARKYHPDVSKAIDAEARFKEVAEAYVALKDVEKRAAYDDAAVRFKHGQEFSPPPDWDSSFESSGGFGDGEPFSHSDFFDMLFGRHAARADASQHAAGTDQHAKVQIELKDSYLGGHRSVGLRVPMRDSSGKLRMQDLTLDVNIPKGIRAGQHLRLAGQGAPGRGDGPPGDLYLEIEFVPHSHFRSDGRDVYLDLPISPWEAALGATFAVPMPDGSVQLTVPAGSSQGRKLRIKGKGLPGKPAGDLYAVLSISQPLVTTPAAEAAYRDLGAHFAGFNPRLSLEGLMQ